MSADLARSMLYAADLSTAQSGYAYGGKQHDFADRVQPTIVALNSKTVCFSPPHSSTHNAAIVETAAAIHVDLCIARSDSSCLGESRKCRVKLSGDTILQQSQKGRGWS